MDLIGARFELREPIASGGTSTVWRAYDHELGIECAAKVLRMRDAGGLMRFAREQSRRLEGHHVVAPYAWVADDGTALIAFELMTGGSLRTLIGDYGPLADATIVTILDQLLDALDNVHSAGIAHRDVKPANVLLRATGDGPIDVALADFGIAIAFTDARLTIAGTVIGTPGYMPPEVLRGEAAPEKSHDLFALGCTAVALVLGHENGMPEEATTLIEDPVLARVLRALTAVDPQSRPANIQEALRLLIGAVRNPLPHDRDGESITVFDQIGPGESDVAGVETLPIPDPQERAQNPKEPRQMHSMGAEPASWPIIAGVDSGQHSPVVRQPMPASIRLPRSLLAATTLAVAGIISFVVWNGSQEGNPVTPTDGVTETLAPGETQGPTEVGRPSATPTVPKENAPNVGDTCTWLTEGDMEIAQSGVEIQCRLEDGEYVWRAP